MKDKVAFETHVGTNSVEVPVQSLDRLVVLKEGQTFETNDPAVVAALDANPNVKRVSTDAGEDDSSAKPSRSPRSSS